MMSVFCSAADAVCSGSGYIVFNEQLLPLVYVFVTIIQKKQHIRFLSEHYT